MAETGRRFCPICAATSNDENCDEDAVPTVPRDLLERPLRDVQPGDVAGGRYRIERLLGEGGMGRVFVARQISMNRRVALKTLKPREGATLEALRRFYVEARAAARLQSPHVVRVHDFGIDEGSGLPFLVMELLRGRTLHEMLAAEGPLPPRRVARLLAQVALVLAEAAKTGIVHRDLKPDNIFMVDTELGYDFVKVMDFGIARATMADGATPERITADGTAIGTVAYMSPEQARGEAVDVRADLYALGCILFELFMGHPPYRADNPLAILTRHLTDPVPELPEELPCGEALPLDIALLHEALMAKDAARRPGQPRAVAEILAAVGKGAEIDAVAVLAEAAQASRRDAGGVPYEVDIGSPTDAPTRHVSSPKQDRFTSSPPPDSDELEIDRRSLELGLEDEDEAPAPLVPGAVPLPLTDSRAVPSPQAGDEVLAYSESLPVDWDRMELAVDPMTDNVDAPGARLLFDDPRGDGGRTAALAAAARGKKLRWVKRLAILAILVAAGFLVWPYAQPELVRAGRAAGEWFDELMSSAAPSSGSDERRSTRVRARKKRGEPESKRAQRPARKAAARKAPLGGVAYLAIETSPAGAWVLRRGRVVCRQTPCELEVPVKDGPVSYTVRKRGYRDQKVNVMLGEGARLTKAVVLERK